MRIWEGDTMTLAAVWREHLSSAMKQQMSGTCLLAFSLVMDVLVRVTPEQIDEIISMNPDLDFDEIESSFRRPKSRVRSREDFLSILANRLKTGKALQVVCEDPKMYGWFDENFPGRTERLGGQAGIKANQLAVLGLTSILYTPNISKKQAGVVSDRVLFPVVDDDDGLQLRCIREAARQDDPTRTAWVFEYDGDRTYDFGFEQIRAPRANRLIMVQPSHGLDWGFGSVILEHLPLLGEQVDLAMLSGYQLGGPNPEDDREVYRYFQRSEDAIRLLKDANARLKSHYEYVAGKTDELSHAVLSRIVPLMDSFGINETEIIQVLSLMGERDLAEHVRADENAYTLCRAGLLIQEKYDLSRLHIHNLGYYVVILRKPYPIEPARVRQACLFASGVNAVKAACGGYPDMSQLQSALEYPISEIGLEQIDLFAEKIEGLTEFVGDKRKFRETGIADLGDHYIVIVPTQIIPNPAVTVGMGDTISATSYAMELLQL